MVVALIIIALAALALYYTVIRPYSFWANTGVKCLTPPNLWGAIKGSFFLNQDALYTFAPGEPYIGITTLGGPIVSVRDPDLIKVVLSNDSDSFMDRGMPSLTDKRDPMSINPFLRDGARWRYLHVKTSPMMTPLKLRGVFEITKDVVDRMITLVSPYADTGEAVDFYNMMKRCLADILFGVAFGAKGNIMSEPDNPFYIMLQEHFKVTPMKVLNFNLLMAFPWMAHVLPLDSGNAALKSFFLDPFLASLDERKKNGLKRGDFIDFFLDIQNKEVERSKIDGTQIEFTDHIIAALVWSFFVAASESSGHVVSGALIELAHHPDVQNRAREEVKAAMAKNGGLTYDAIKSLPYLDQVIREALRMYPTAKTLKRRTTRKFRMPDGRVTLPPRTRVIINISKLQRDPKHYPDPDKFDPDRFAPENRNEQNHYTFLSFGEGPRKCFGIPMAKNQLRLILATLLSQFQIRPKPGVPYPPERLNDTVFNSFKHGAPLFITRV